MKKMKKLISITLCIAMTGFGFPAMAVQQSDIAESKAEVTVLNDAVLEQLVGAGAVDVKVAEYALGEPAVAVFSNLSLYYPAYYTLYESNANGDFVGAITSGSLAPGQAIIASGPIANRGGGYMIQGEITSTLFSGIHASDSYMH